MEGTVMIKRVCGHSSPYTFKPNERYGKQRLEKFLSKKCPECTVAAIAELEAQQKAQAAALRKQAKPAAETNGSAEPQPPNRGTS